MRQHAEAGWSGGPDHALQVLVSLSKHNLTRELRSRQEQAEIGELEGRVEGLAVQSAAAVAQAQWRNTAGQTGHRNGVESEDVLLIKPVVR